MLDQLRRNSRSWLIWFIFAILIAAFVLFFGPQSGPEMFGCAGSASTVAEVDGHEIKAHSWRFAMNSLGGTGGASAAQRRAVAIDRLVERQILAAEAERVGMKVSDDLVRDKIKVGEIYLLGSKIDGRNIFFQNEVFDYRLLELWVKNSGLSSVDAFIQEQKREILANLARDMFVTSSRVSLEEARSDFIDNNTQITLDYVLLRTGDYAAALDLSEADAERYASTHEEDIKEAWETEKAQFSSEKARVLARMILVNKATTPPAKEGEETEAPADDSKARAEAALARATGGEDFAALAKEVSDDSRSKRRGGLLGWRSADALGYGSAVVEAVKGLEPGQVSGLVEGPRGYHIIKLEARADKALTYEQRKPDIAYRLATKYYSEKLAARDAAAALAKTEGKTLAEVFERKAAPPTFQPGMDPAIQRQIQEQLQRSLDEQKKKEESAPAPAPDGEKSGWILREGDIQFAQAGAPAATSTPPSAEPAADGEVLPAITVPEPKVEKLGPLSRPGDKLAGIGRNKELIRDLFENLDEGQVGAKVYPVTEPDGLVIVQLIDRTEADLEEFAKRADITREQMALAEGASVLFAFLDRRCRDLATKGNIGVNKMYLKYDEDKPPIQYSACASLSQQSVVGQLITRYPALQALAYGLF